MLNLAGESYGEWKVICEAPRRGLHRYWKCKCSCGTVLEIRQGALRDGTSTKCKQGHHLQDDYGTCHRFYATSASILKRCTNKNDPSYQDYGGRGIKVYFQWVSKPMEITRYLAKLWLEQFGNSDYSTYGTKANHVTLDRIDNDKGYEPGNLRFVTWTEQANNKRN